MEEPEDFSSAAWAPERQAYGILHMLRTRAAMDEDLPKPPEVAHLKFLSLAREPRPQAAPAAPGAEVSQAAPAASSAPSAPSQPAEPAAADASAPGSGGDRLAAGAAAKATQETSRAGAWWQVRGDEVIVREGACLFSRELRRESPGAWLQQAGPEERRGDEKGAGVVRLPVRPAGWVTADARDARGPLYLSPAPRWRTAYGSGSQSGDVLVREEAAIHSREVAALRKGDVVQQAGPQERRGGVLRMRVALPAGALPPPEAPHATGPLAEVGWVTLDASAAGGPVFFVPE